MNIRKTKPLRFSIIFYQRAHRLTHALSVSRRRAAPPFPIRERFSKIIGQTIIKNYIEQRKESGGLSAAQFLCFLKSPRIRKELDASTNRSIDMRLDSEYRYYRSRPSLAFHMTREITRQLICHNPQPSPHAAEDTAKRSSEASKERGEQDEKIKIVREEFMLTPQLLQIISDKVATMVFRNIELERLRSGL